MADSAALIAFVAAWVVVMGGTAVLLGRNKGRSFIERFFVGLFLGPLGWLIAWKMKPPMSAEQRRAQEERFERERAEWKGERV